MFDRIKTSNPSLIQKIKPVSGDVTINNLGINRTDEETLINKITIVFHLAATTAFDETLECALNMNVKGTKNVISFCKKIKHLDVLLHLSTTFCSPDLSKFKEEIYDPPADPEDVLNFADLIKGEALNEIAPKLIKPHPNTYTYTKRLAETLVARSYDELKIAIVRPSIGKFSENSFFTLFYFKEL